MTSMVMTHRKVAGNLCVWAKNKIMQLAHSFRRNSFQFCFVCLANHITVGAISNVCARVISTRILKKKGDSSFFEIFEVQENV